MMCVPIYIPTIHALELPFDRINIICLRSVQGLSCSTRICMHKVPELNNLIFYKLILETMPGRQISGKLIE